MEVYMPGTRIIIGLDRDISAIIKRTVIHRDKSATYDVEWWDGRESKTDNMTDHDFDVQYGGKEPIGFLGIQDVCPQI